MAITRSQIARQLLEEGGLSSRLEEERDLSNPLVGRVLGPLGEIVKREGPGLLKDVATLVATGGLSKADAARRVIGSRLLGSVTRPVVQRVIRGESEPQPPTNFGAVTSQGEYVPPSDLVSITDDSGADTGFSEYSDPGTAASYEGSFAEGGDVSVKDAEMMAPPGESLAYINDDEAALLKALGGAGEAVNQTGIPSYFIKKVFKKAKKAVKKVVKSDLGKAALAAAALYYAPGFGIKAAGGLKPFLVGAPTNLATGKAAFSGILGTGGQFAPSVGKLATSIFGPQGLTKFSGTQKALAGITAASVASGLMTPKQEEQDSVTKLIADKTGIDVAAIRKEVQDAYAAGDISGLKTKYPFLGEIRTIAAEGGIMKMKDGGLTKYEISSLKGLGYDTKGGTVLKPFGGIKVLRDILKVNNMAEGGIMMASNIENDKILENLFEKYLDMGLSLEDAAKKAREEFDRMSKKQGIERATAAEGGMMDLGGNEMDLRGGGFVPIGKEEKADDVPARLSKNEFVFTADAVRAAGGGSVDKGADLMYKTMKQLENKVA
jgi:hypothetical protein